MKPSEKLKEIDTTWNNSEEGWLDPKDADWLIARVKKLEAALGDIKFNRGSTAVSTNADNYALARKALEGDDES